MRLICGILHLDGTAASATVLDRMTAAMTASDLAPVARQRLDGALGLAVLDFTGKQDELTERENWIIAADARFYRTVSDAPDVMLDAIRRHGADFPDHINGDFAVALWRRDTRELWLGRDFIGVRPLAWTWQPSRWFAFASLPKGLYGAGLASTRIDPIALGSKIAQYYFTGSDTGFAEIAYLQAGHSLCVRAQDTSPPRSHRAYCPEPSQVGTWRGSPEQAADTLRRLVQEAVVARLPTEGAVACHLTGGLDSSSITVLAAREARQRGLPVLALSMTTHSPLGPTELDERPLIDAVLEQEQDVVQVGVRDVLPMPGLPEDADWNGSIVGGSDDQMMAAAAAFGAERMLCGVGGDEGASYNGANLYLSLLREGHLLHLATQLAARAADDGISLSKTIRNRLLVPLLPSALRRLKRRRPGVMDKTHGVARYLAPNILDGALRRCMPPVLQSNRPAERVCAFADHHIPSRCTYYAVMAARHGLSVGFPLLDRRIVDFMLSLPVHLFLADGQSRQPFRRAMRGILPDRVRLAKQKVGLYDERFTRYAALKGQLLAKAAKLREARSPRVMEMFNLDAIQRMLEQLPEPEQASQFIRTKPDSLVGGNPPWVPLVAVRFLIAAWRLSKESEGTDVDSIPSSDGVRIHPQEADVSKRS